MIERDIETGDLLQIEPSIDADSRAPREARFAKKFSAGAKYVFSGVFPRLAPETSFEGVAIFMSHPTDADELGGARIRSVDELFAEVRAEAPKCSVAAKRAILEQSPVLRTIRLAQNGCCRVAEQSLREGRHPGAAREIRER